MNKLLILTATLVLQSCATYAPDQYTDTDPFDEPFDEEFTKAEFEAELEAKLEAETASQNIEEFECKDGNALYWNKIIVELVADLDENIGFVHVSGVEYDAIYTVKGIERMWIFGDWADNENRPSYYISLKPNGIAHYFDLTDVSPDAKTVTSKAIFECRSTN